MTQQLSLYNYVSLNSFMNSENKILPTSDVGETTLFQWPRSSDGKMAGINPWPAAAHRRWQVTVMLWNINNLLLIFVGRIRFKIWNFRPMEGTWHLQVSKRSMFIKNCLWFSLPVDGRILKFSTSMSGYMSNSYACTGGRLAWLFWLTWDIRLTGVGRLAWVGKFR